MQKLMQKLLGAEADAEGNQCMMQKLIGADLSE